VPLIESIISGADGVCFGCGGIPFAYYFIHISADIIEMCLILPFSLIYYFMCFFYTNY
jgi:predicted membrane chloride channel (bestrophin family)